MIDGRRMAETEGWGPPFPVEEYRARVEKVRREMGRRGIDLLLVSSPPNITYLTGYDMIWYYLTSPVSVAVHAESGQTLFFEISEHQPTVEWHTVVDDGEYFEEGRAAYETIVSALKKRSRKVESCAEWGDYCGDRKGFRRCGGEGGGWLVGCGPGEANQIGHGDRGNEEGRSHSGHCNGGGPRSHSAGRIGN